MVVKDCLLSTRGIVHWEMRSVLIDNNRRMQIMSMEIMLKTYRIIGCYQNVSRYKESRMGQLEGPTFQVEH